MASLVPYKGPFGKAELIHLLRRTMFGVTKSDIKTLVGKSMDDVVRQLMVQPSQTTKPLKTYFTTTNGVKNDNLDPTIPMGSTWVDTPIAVGANPNPNGYRRISYKSWWTGLQITQTLSIFEKMVLFWHNHFATEDSVIDSSQMAYFTNVVLRKNALGNFRSLVKEITLDPGMLRYLNGERNKKTAPDENYGRELQELFCIGKGAGAAFTEDDVKAAAKVLTGWYVIYQQKDANNVTQNVNPRTEFAAANHDTSSKQFSSFYNNTVISRVPKTGEEKLMAEREIDDLISMLLGTKECAKFLCRRLWTFFVYYDITPDIETNVIEPLAEILRQNYDIKETLIALFTSDEFYKPINRGCMIKSPTDFHIGMLRQYGFPIPSNTEAEKMEIQYIFYAQMRNHILNQGFDLGDPPNVAGWPAYYQTPSFHEMWVDTSSYPLRKTSYESISRSEFSTGTNVFFDANKNIKIKTNFIDFVKAFDNPSDPNDLINEAVELLFGVPVTQQVKDQLKSTYLLLGQASDYYWTDAYQTYIANPSTSDPEAKRVPQMLIDLFIYMQGAAEFHLC